MAGQGVVVAACLMDTAEIEQPGPLCLPPPEIEELTWRHFETLLKSLYRYPPDEIKVKYVDNEKDWVELGSDEELLEAIRLTQVSGEILQLRVQRLGSETKEMSSSSILDSSLLQVATGETAGHVGSTEQFILYIPTTDPGGDVSSTLVYPHPEKLVYPGQCLVPAISSVPAVPDKLHMTEPPVLPLNSQSPTTLFEHQASTVVKDSSPGVEGSTQGARPGCGTQLIYPHPSQGSKVSDCTIVEQAASLATEAKVRHLKNIIASHHSKQKQNNKHTPGEISEADLMLHLDSVPVFPQKGPVSQSFISNQDPFELESSSSSSSYSSLNDFEQFNGSNPVKILMPVKVKEMCGENDPTVIYTCSSSADKVGEVEPAHSTATQTTKSPEGQEMSGSPGVQTAALSSKASLKTYSSAVIPKAKMPKKLESSPPIPMPRNLLMMEGAQSGANAVAIEMPSESETYLGAASNKEEEIAASGGASSTSASEETGETMSRGGTDAASVIREVKVSGPADSCSEATVAAIPRLNLFGPEKPQLKGAEKEKSKERERSRDKKTDALGIGAKLKVASAKKSSSTDSGLKKVKVQSGEGVKTKVREKPTLQVLDDVESGEKATLPAPTKPEMTNLQYEDFIKHMRKVKKQIHTGVVKDVSKQMDKLFKRTYSRSASWDSNSLFCNVKKTTDTIHKGITCDHCDLEIVGVRYKCGNCVDFDLCENCESSEFVHDPTHVFLKLRKPARKAGCLGKTRVALLRENIYEAEKFWEQKRKEREERKALLEKKKEKEEKKKEKEVEKKKKEKEDERKKKKEHKMGKEKELEKKKKKEREVRKEKHRELQNNPRDVTKSLELVRSRLEHVKSHADGLEQTSDLEWQDMHFKASSPADLPDLLELMEKRSPKFLYNQEFQIPTEPTWRSSVKEESRSVEDGEAVCVMSALKTCEETESLHPVTPLVVGEPRNDSERCKEEVEEPFGTSVSQERRLSDSSGSSIVRLSLPSCTQDSQPFCPQETLGIVLTPPSAAARNDDCLSETQDLGPESCNVDGQGTEDEGVGQEHVDEAELNPEEDDEDEGFDVNSVVSSVSSCYEMCDSDSSEDFLVIDPPNREDYLDMEEEQDEEEEEEFSQSLGEESKAAPAPCEGDQIPPVVMEDENNNDQVSVEDTERPPPQCPDEATDTQSFEELTCCEGHDEVTHTEEASNSQDLGEVTSTDGATHSQGHAEVRRTDETSPIQCLDKDTCTVEATSSQGLDQDVCDLGLVHRMTEEEKAMYLRLLKMKMDKEYEMEKMMERAVQTEIFARMEKDAEERMAVREQEAEYMEILEVKQMQAALQNRRLEEAAQQVKLAQRPAAEQRVSDKVTSVGSCTLQQQDSEVDGAPLRSEDGSQSRSTSETFSRQTSTQTQCETLSDESQVSTSVSREEKRDAKCQTTPEPGAQASYIIQNVASGMTKAATTALSTAKDVFYSLQAKQNEWKAAGSTYKPPQSEWKPKANTWTPPAQTWTPPPDDYVPPTSKWSPPASTWSPSQVILENSFDSANASVNTPSVDGEELPIEDTSVKQVDVLIPATRIAPQGESIETGGSDAHSMQRLAEMGFQDMERNQALLIQCHGNLEEVVQCLLQEDYQLV